MSLEIPQTPAEIAAEVVLFRLDDPSFGRNFVATREEEIDLIWLSEAADKANLFGNWFIDAGLGFQIPRSFEVDEDIEYTRIDGLYFDGNFANFSRVSIGTLGEHAVRAICVVFDSGTLVNLEFETLDEESMLHIPVLSVNEMSRTYQ